VFITETILVILTVAIFKHIFRKRDWYTVEWRRSDDLKMDTDMYSSHWDSVLEKYSVFDRSKDKVIYKNDDKETIIIQQWVFDDYHAAQKYFNYLKDVIGGSNRIEKIYIWRIVDRTRTKAFRLPPTCDYDENAILLETYPPFDEWTEANEPSLYTQREP